MSETRPSDSCRICKYSFKVKFGNVSGKQFYSSSQNLFKPSQRKDSFEIVLAVCWMIQRYILIVYATLVGERFSVLVICVRS